MKKQMLMNKFGMIGVNALLVMAFAFGGVPAQADAAEKPQIHGIEITDPSME